MNNIELNWRESLLRTRPAKVCDWADEKATDLFGRVQLMPGNTVVDICNTLAVALRSERAKGYADALTWADRNLGVGVPRVPGPTWRSPGEERSRREQCRAIAHSLFDDCQRDSDVERTEGWGNGSAAL